RKLRATEVSFHLKTPTDDSARFATGRRPGSERRQGVRAGSRPRFHSQASAEAGRALTFRDAGEWEASDPMTTTTPTTTSTTTTKTVADARWQMIGNGLLILVVLALAGRTVYLCRSYFSESPVTERFRLESSAL